jgi:hypothetical protein
MLAGGSQMIPAGIDAFGRWVVSPQKVRKTIESGRC